MSIELRGEGKLQEHFRVRPVLHCTLCGEPIESGNPLAPSGLRMARLYVHVRSQGGASPDGTLTHVLLHDEWSHMCTARFEQELGESVSEWESVHIREYLRSLSSLYTGESFQTAMMAEKARENIERLGLRAVERLEREEGIMPTEELKVYTTDEVARMLRVKQETIRGWCANRKIRSAKLPDGRYRIPRSEVARFAGLLGDDYPAIPDTDGADAEETAEQFTERIEREVLR